MMKKSVAMMLAGFMAVNTCIPVVASDVGAQLEEAYHETLRGSTQQVLFEQVEDGLWAGHAPNYIKVYAESAEDLHNRVLPVQITQLCRDGVLGVLA